MSSIVTKAINNVDCHALKLYRNVASLFDVDNKYNKYSDVQLTVGYRTFYCHKLILQLNGYDFKKDAALKNNMLLQTINPDQFYEVLQFMYTGEVLVSTNNIESLLLAAWVLRMDDLIQICFRFLEEIISRKDGETINNDIRLKLTSVYQSFAIRCIKNFKNSNRLILNHSSETFLKVILNADDLGVKSEEEVCDLLLNWLQLHTDAPSEVHLDQLLPLIRWSGISNDYVTSNIFTNKILMSDPMSVTFLSKVTTYLMTGVEFEGLQTLHRKSTGLANSLMVIGLNDGYSQSSNVYSIDLQYSDNVTKLDTIPTNMNVGSVACMYDKNVYVTGAGEDTLNETWKWKKSTGWTKRRTMLTSRLHHCAAINNSKLYVLGGLSNSPEDDEYTPLSSVESYNLDTNNWFSAGDIIHPVWNAACATYKSSIHVFGGANDGGEPVDYVQIYNTENKSSRVLDQRMPHAHRHMRAVLWDMFVILLGQKTCYIYEFETDTWQERKQFKTDLISFGIAFDNTRIYLVGGGTFEEYKSEEKMLICTNKIRSISVKQIIANKPAVWVHHAELPQPSLIYAHCSISLHREQDPFVDFIEQLTLRYWVESI